MKIIFCIFFVFIWLTSYSQIQIAFGPEIGINSSGILRPNNNIPEQTGEVIKESSLPLLSPKIGGFFSLKMCKHFIISSGLNYRVVGERWNSYHSEKFLVNPYISDEYRKQIFHVISAPLNFGYNFKVINKEYQFNIGYNFNSYVASKLYERSIYDGLNTELIEKEITSDPFNIEDFNVAASRWNNQFSVGFGVDLNERVNILLNSFLGIPVSYRDMWYDGMWCYTSVSSNNHDNFDLSFAAKFNLNKSE